MAQPGEPLDSKIREQMEKAFGADFSTVRIHRDAPATTTKGAVALAAGEAIHFAPGRYDTGSPAGRECLGHELTHVLQQRAGRALDDGEAVKCGKAAATGEPAPLHAPATPPKKG